MNDQKTMEELNGYVRLALPLMSKNNIPVTPRNYAVWLEYVSGGNNELVETINTMLEGGEAFSDEENETLYWQFCAEKDEKELRELRENLQKILATFLIEIKLLGGQTEKFESLVSHSLSKLSGEASVQEIKNIVNEILDETKSIWDYGKTLQQRLKETTEELETLQEELEQTKTQSLEDFLTGIPNRKAFDEKLTTCADMASSDNKDLCLLLIDIDHFKKFNDKHGHMVGDEVLKFAAKKIKEIVRGRDFVARFGGEEFIVILPQTPLPGAQKVAENIRIFFDQTKLKTAESSKNLGTVTVSIGAAHYRPSEPLEEFVFRADQALYFAKNAGRNCVATESDLASSKDA